MNFSQRAVEAAAKALRAERGLYGNPTPSSLRQAKAALTAALAMDGVALVPRELTQAMIDEATGIAAGDGVPGGLRQRCSPYMACHALRSI